MSLAYKMVLSIVLFWFTVVGHRLFLYRTEKGSCAPYPGFYNKFDAHVEVITSGVLPPIILLALGYLLLRSVRQVVHRRILPIGVAIQGRRVKLTQMQQIGGQMTTMLILQSFVVIPSFLPYGAQNLYSSITQDWYKTSLRTAWENIVIEIIRLFSYVFFSTSFYISYVSSRGFRRTVSRELRLKRILTSFIRGHINDQPIANVLGQTKCNNH
jgi:hypothetical protein